MTSRILVSACLVVKDDPFLPKAIESIRKWVDEICIVDSSVVPARAAEAKALADRYEREDDGIQDWSVLRDRSFALASHGAVLWLDSDDEVEGLEYLQSALTAQAGQLGAVRFVCPYEYDHDPDTGACVRVQPRERIVMRREHFRWERPAHENLVARPGIFPVDIRESRIVWKHRRPHGTASGRSLTILQAYDAPNARTLLDIGFELAATDVAGAVDHLTRYLAGQTNNYDACRACLRLAELVGDPQDFTPAIEWARKAVDYEPRSFAARFKFASLMIAAGMVGGLEGSIRIGAREARAARDLPEDVTLVPWSPKERSHDVHALIVQAYTWLGDDDLRDEAIKVWLRSSPTPAALLAAGEAWGRQIPPAKAGDGKRLRIAFACPTTPQSWNPAKAARLGVGGSETAVIEMAKRLAAMGHDVRVYANVGTEGSYDYVDYVSGARLSGAPAVDVLIAWRDARMLSMVEATTKLLWVHDLAIGGFSYDRVLEADRVLAVSKWHADHLCKTYKIAPGHVVATRNGIDPQRCVPIDSGIFARDSHRAIYSSSPDRGLAVLLDLWPRIREQIPDAKLDVYYGFQGWREYIAQTNDPQHKYLVAALERKLEETPGVTHHGRRPQSELATAMLEAGVWAYPTGFSETSCITAMEAQAAGLRVVTSRLAALAETVETGHLIDGDHLSPEYQAEFVEAVVTAMREQRAKGLANKGGSLKTASRFSWDRIAAEWATLFGDLLAEAADGILPAYSPAMAA